MKSKEAKFNLSNISKSKAFSVLVLALILTFAQSARSQTFGTQVTRNHFLEEDLQYRNQLAAWEQRREEALRRQRDAFEQRLMQQQREYQAQMERRRQELYQQQLRIEQQRQMLAMQQQQVQRAGLQEQPPIRSFSRSAVFGTEEVQQPEPQEQPVQEQVQQPEEVAAVAEEEPVDEPVYVEEEPELVEEEAGKDGRTSIFTHLRKALW